MERYQTGALEKRKTSLGLCWYIRFRGSDGERPRFRVGLVADLPTKAAARRAADEVRREFNTPTAEKPRPVMLFRDLIRKYEAEGMPGRYSTSKSYKSMVKVHILPKWGTVPVTDVHPQPVKTWLLDLPLAPKTRGHIKGLMSVLFRYAMFLGATPREINPMALFTIPSQRKKEPRILTHAEFKLLVSKITVEPFRTMVIVCAYLGLRCSELIGLRWEDIDWMEKKVYIRTGIVNGRADDVKTAASRKRLPLHPELADVLLKHLNRSDDNLRDPDDWIFASSYYFAGEKPYDPGDVRKRYIVPAAKAACLGDGIGWHTFRHSYRAWLGENGAEMEIQRDLMRHSNISTTMDIYGGTFPEGLREANAKVIERLLQ